MLHAFNGLDIHYEIYEWANISKTELLPLVVLKLVES